MSRSSSHLFCDVGINNFEEYEIAKNHVATLLDFLSYLCADIGHVAVSLVEAVKVLFDVCTAFNTHAESIMLVMQPGITEDLRNLVKAVKTLQSVGPSFYPSYQKALTDLKKSMDEFYKVMTQPILVCPTEYYQVFEKGALIVKLAVHLIDKSVKYPANAQDDALQVVAAFKDLITIWLESSEATKTLLPDKRPAIYSTLGRMVNEVKSIDITHLIPNERISYIRTISALAEILHEWFGERFGLSLRSQFNALQLVKDRCIEAVDMEKYNKFGFDNLVELTRPKKENEGENEKVGKRVSILSDDEGKTKDTLNVPTSTKTLAVTKNATPSRSMEINRSSRISFDPKDPSPRDSLETSRDTSPRSSSETSRDKPNRSLETTKNSTPSRSMEINSRPQSMAGDLRPMSIVDSYNTETLRKYGAKFFASAIADYEINISNARVQMLHFKTNDLIAVINDEGREAWSGANTRTGETGLFPPGFVRVILESVQMLRDTILAQESKPPEKIEIPPNSMNSAALIRMPSVAAWIPGFITLSGSVLRLTTNQKLKSDKTLPSFHLPDCAFSFVSLHEKALNSTYGNRGLQIENKQVQEKYLLAISGEEKRTEWMKAITMASLSAPPSPVAAKAQKARGRRLTLFSKSSEPDPKKEEKRQTSYNPTLMEFPDQPLPSNPQTLTRPQSPEAQVQTLGRPQSPDLGPPPLQTLSRPQSPPAKKEGIMLVPVGSRNDIESNPPVKQKQPPKRSRSLFARMRPKFM